MAMTHILFSHSSRDEHLGSFYFSVIMNEAAVNTHEQVFVWTRVFISFGYTPRSGIAGSYNSVFNPLRTTRLFFKSSCSVFHQQRMSYDFSTFLVVLHIIKVGC